MLVVKPVKRGLNVVVFDENEKPGGQLFKQIDKFFGSKEHRAKVRGFVIAQQLLKIWLHFRCVYRNAVEKGIGTKLNLWDTPKMV